MDTAIHPPQSITKSFLTDYRIFLGGSIEMGKAVEWQQEFITTINTVLSGQPNVSYTFYNPRRKDWDSTLVQSFEEAQFYQQVNWELDALEKATHIVMYLQPGTLSPISLLELGLYARSGKLMVVSPEGFWRKGNVDIVCSKYGVLQFESLDAVTTYIINKIIS